MNNKQLKNMKQALRDHYQAKSLSVEQTDDLLMMINNKENLLNHANGKNTFAKNSAKSSEITPHWWHLLMPNTRNYQRAFYITACLLLACLVTVYSLLDQEPLSQRIMDEIVYNHNQDMPIEIASTSISEISDYLSKLNFSIIMPSTLSDPNWELLGGRYCTINGKLAAQLKVKNLKDNSISTLYQAAIDDDISEANNSSLGDTIDGVGVSIWKEHGLLLGLAREKNVLEKQ